MGIVTKKKKYKDSLKSVRTMSRISLVWGILYLPLMISAAAYASLGALKTIFIALAAAVFCLPFYILPIYFSKHYPKGNKPHTIKVVSLLIAVRYILYPVLAFMLTDDKTVIYSVCALSMAGLAVFAVAVKNLWKNDLQSLPVYINSLFNILPVITAAAAVVASAVIFGRTEGGVGDIIGSILLMAALSLGEILLHIAIYLFCRKAKPSAK